MAGEIYIADKETLDSVKQDTSKIKNLDPLKHKSLLDVPKTGDLHTVVEINGSGYLKNAFIVGKFSDFSGTSLTITIDDEIVLDLYISGPNHLYATGLCKTYSLTSYGSTSGLVSIEGYYNYIKNDAAKNGYSFIFPSSQRQDVTAYGALICIEELIKFNTSLKIEGSGGKEIFVEYFID